MAGGGFRRRVRGALGCERGNKPEWTVPVLLVLIMALVAVLWFRGAHPDRAAAVGARAVIAHLLSRLMLLGVWLVCVLALVLLAWAAVGCWLEAHRERGGPPAAGPDGGAAGAAGSVGSDRSA